MLIDDVIDNDHGIDWDNSIILNQDDFFKRRIKESNLDTETWLILQEVHSYTTEVEIGLTARPMSWLKLHHLKLLPVHCITSH